MPFAGPKEVPEGAKSLHHEERDAILAHPPLLCQVPTPLYLFKAHVITIGPG